MLTKEEWLSGFATELTSLTRGLFNLEKRFVLSVSMQQWERLSDESPKLVARRWASRAGLRCAFPPSPPTKLIWISECAQEIHRQQPSLSPGVANALAHLQRDMHGELSPMEAALLWIANHSPEPIDKTAMT